MNSCKYYWCSSAICQFSPLNQAGPFSVIFGTLTNIIITVKTVSNKKQRQAKAPLYQEDQAHMGDPPCGGLAG